VRVDPVRDFLRTRGTIRGTLVPALLATYLPGETDRWADPPERIRGVKGPAQVMMVGDVATTKASWTITSLTSDLVLARPPLLSKITACGETWRIDSITDAPMEGRLFVCETTLVET